MFEQLYQLPHALARQRDGPLAAERRRYLAHCAKQQMAQDSLRKVAQLTLVITKALRLAERPAELIAQSEIDAEADRWVNRPKPQRIEKLLLAFKGHAVRWLTYLRRLQPSPSI